MENKGWLELAGLSFPLLFTQCISTGCVSTHNVTPPKQGDLPIVDIKAPGLQATINLPHFEAKNSAGQPAVAEAMDATENE